MRNDRERLQDILKAIDKIFEKTNRGRDVFTNDELLQVWVLHRWPAGGNVDFETLQAL